MNILNKGYQKYLIGKARKEGYDKGLKDMVNSYSAAMMLVLNDKFAFNNEQLKEAADHINATFGAIGEGYLTVEDIQETLEAETGLVIRFAKDKDSNA